MRARNYIQKPSEEWKLQIEALSSTTLFLVARPGPTVFVLKDELDNTYKLTIGNPHKCSCGEIGCIHMAYCIAKVLKVPKEHPLSYQTSLTDSELDLVLSGTLWRLARDAPRTIIEQQRQQRNARVQREEGSPKQKVDPGYVTRQLLNEDENTCTICQDDMTNEQPLTWCRHGCGNNFHSVCMMKFAQHKTSSKQDPSCPLCRELWDMALLKLDCKVKSAAKHPCINTSCCNCKCRLRRLFHRCLECSQKGTNTITDFCSDCFSRLNEGHRSHHFLTSDASIDNVSDVTWHPTQNPYSSSSSSHRATTHLSALQHRDLSVDDYDMLLQLDHKPEETVCSTLLASLPEVSTEASRLTGCWCSADNSPLMLLLPCAHIAHRLCMQEELRTLEAQDISGIAEYRCQHAGCGKRLFQALRRRQPRPRPQPKPSADTQATTVSSAALDQGQKKVARGHLAELGGWGAERGLLLGSVTGSLCLPQVVGAGLGDRTADHSYPRMPLQSMVPKPMKKIGTIGRRHSADGQVEQRRTSSQHDPTPFEQMTSQPPADPTGLMPIGVSMRYPPFKKLPMGIGALRSLAGSRRAGMEDLSLQALPLGGVSEVEAVATRESRQRFLPPAARPSDGAGLAAGAIGQLHVAPSFSRSSSLQQFALISAEEGIQHSTQRRRMSLQRPTPSSIRREALASSRQMESGAGDLNQLINVVHYR